ncbi:DUF805 domain-containing protein [Arenivirga flava]|uniref:DUF805 domain-containing protein n=1 Tax=Arenivirga flava TaxID=1930060 RepID=A0AA37UU38_9MICO|nr:DUF805 domain-containing protein [Arenivirga flava]GMA28552.1 hypothetical protein GCM10025874_18050 [Arenivirga flava]
MSFGAAIAAFFRGYAEFTGTSRRSEFWWAILFTVLVSAGLGIVSGGLVTGPAAVERFGATDSWAVSLWSLVTLVPTLAITVRRLRDAGYGWPFAFFLLVPLVGLAFIAYLCAQPTRAADTPDAAAD